MLGKLMKYDMEWHNRVFIPLYLIAIVFALITRLVTMAGETSFLFSVMGTIMTTLSYVLLLNVLINTITRIISKFVSSMYKDESYLTHTLPVSIKTVFLAKVLVGIIYMFISVLVVLVSLVILLYTKDNFIVLKQTLEVAASAYDSTIWMFLLMIAITFIIEFILFQMVGYLGVVLGHSSEDSRSVYSILIGLGSYFMVQIVTVILIAGISLFVPAFREMITSNTIRMDVLKMLLVACNIIYVGFIFLYYFIARHNLLKGVNIE